MRRRSRASPTTCGRSRRRAVEQARRLGVTLSLHPTPPRSCSPARCCARGRRRRPIARRHRRRAARRRPARSRRDRRRVCARRSTGLEGPVATVGHQPDCSEIAARAHGRRSGLPDGRDAGARAARLSRRSSRREPRPRSTPSARSRSEAPRRSDRRRARRSSSPISRNMLRRPLDTTRAGAADELEQLRRVDATSEEELQQTLVAQLEVLERLRQPFLSARGSPAARDPVDAPRDGAARLVGAVTSPSAPAVAAPGRSARSWHPRRTGSTGR